MADGIGTMTFDNDVADDGFNDGQIDNIFGDDDDIFNAPAPLPPLSPTNLTGEANEGERADEQADDQKKTKKVVKRSPQPRLDDRRLCSDRGIPALKNLCDGIKFKGKGHEASDLNVLLQRFEHWAHRLFPKFTFEDCVDQIEAISGKKLVQNTIKSVRRGDTGDVVDSDEELLMNGDNEGNQAESSSMDNAATFGGEINVEASSAPVPQPDLTEEQKERIRQNRLKALAKRKERQQLEETTLNDTTTENKDTTPSKSPSKANKSLDDENSSDIGNQSPERAKLSFDNEIEETENETMETEEALNETMGTETGENKAMATGETQEETMVTTLMENKAMATGETQEETMVTTVMENETMTAGETQKEPIATEDIQKKPMETNVTQKEASETEVTQNGTIATGDEEEEVLADINANTVNNETMETEITPKKTTGTKTKNAVNQDVLTTEVFENGIDEGDDHVRTENGDVTMETVSAGKHTENKDLMTANLEHIDMET